MEQRKGRAGRVQPHCDEHRESNSSGRTTRRTSASVTPRLPSEIFSRRVPRKRYRRRALNTPILSPAAICSAPTLASKSLSLGTATECGASAAWTGTADFFAATSFAFGPAGAPLAAAPFADARFCDVGRLAVLRPLACSSSSCSSSSFSSSSCSSVGTASKPPLAALVLLPHQCIGSPAT